MIKNIIKVYFIESKITDSRYPELVFLMILAKVH